MKYLSALLVLSLSINAYAQRPGQRGGKDVMETKGTTTVSRALIERVNREMSRVLDQAVEVKVPEKLDSAEARKYETDITNMETAIKEMEAELKADSLKRNQVATFVNSQGSVQAVREAFKDFAEANKDSRSQEMKEAADHAADVVKAIDHMYYLGAGKTKDSPDQPWSMEQMMRLATEIANAKRVDLTREDVMNLERAITRIFNGEFTLRQASRCK